MAGTTLDIEQEINPDQLGTEVSELWTRWNNYRQEWLEDKKELRNYLYATDTTTTKNAMLPWSNTTTIPKLQQIKDNLHANYFAALFPQKRWMRFEGGDQEGNDKAKREVIQAYMESKVRDSGFVDTASDLLDDWCGQYGMCFAIVDWEANYSIKEDGSYIPQYIGPKMHRVSPNDIVFNPTASDFKKSPKIIRSIVTLGEIKRMVDKNPEDADMAKVFGKMHSARQAVLGADGETAKTEAYIADGFSDIKEYYGSNYVEILTFYGDIYNTNTGEFMEDRIIRVVDRAHVLDNTENPSWNGVPPIFMSSWRKRPDNLYGMGPLDSLVGMQYRLDHLENLKADVFDQIAYPMLKIRGDVEDFGHEPGTRIYMGDEGDVQHLAPDSTALNADFQIRELESKMEEMAGAPRQAMGIRTPGEKTAFEVQSLDNSAGRIFQHKAVHLERSFIVDVLNEMLESGRRNMDRSDIIRTLDEATGVALFETIEKSDIVASGKIQAVGASHFAERAQRVQNLTQLYQIKLKDPSVAPHLSGKEMAKIMAEELGEPAIYGENVAVFEQMETAKVAEEAQVQAEEEQLELAEQGL